MRQEGHGAAAAKSPKRCTVPGEKIMEAMASTASSCCVAAKMLDSSF